MAGSRAIAGVKTGATRSVAAGAALGVIVVVGAALSVDVSVAAGAPQGDAVPPPPPTAMQDIVDTLHGVDVPDPYRWLEDQEAPETRAWIDAQNAYTDSVLDRLPGRDALRAQAAAVLERDVVGLPNERGGRYFYSRRAAGQDLAVIHVREGLDGPERVLIDPHPMSPDNTTSAALLDISDDGRRVAWAVREGGVDEISIRVRDVDSGEDLPDVLPPARYGAVTLAADGGGLYYERYGDVTPRVMHHAFGAPLADDTQLFGAGYERHHIPVTVVSDDGRWMVVHVIEGSSGPTEIHVKDLAHDTPFVTAIADGVSESWAGFAGDQLVIVTNLDAPNRRVMLADPADPAAERWREVIPERADVVIEAASGLGGRLAVSYLQDVQPRVAIHELDGAHVRDIAFDTIGSVGGGAGRWTSDEAFFTFETFHVPSTIYRYDLATGAQSVWAAPDLPVEAAAYQVTQRWFASKDGTEVPMFVVHRPDAALDGRNPTLLTGYGGFNLSQTPRFSALATTWLESGGVFALANMRGGSEFGEAWHQAGMLANKQNVFDDFIAAAEHLVDSGYTRPEHLAIRGGSNGGLLVGAVSNQRPDLFGAVVCTYPLLDMVRYHQFLVASFWVPEYGSSDDPEQFAWLHAYSPYHNVIDGGDYPATLYLSGDGDTRVAPLHARKMAALMQAKNGSGRPILLRYHTQAGHSGGQPVSQQIDEMVDTVSFLLWRVGGGGAGGAGSGAAGGGATAEETPGVAAGIRADTLLSATATLASDEFEGRAPGSAGETLTVDFLTEQFAAVGLTPGNPDGTWVQDVPLVGITPQPGERLTVTAPGGESRTLEPAVDYVAATKHVVDEVSVADAEFVFVGYGARAPEYEWDDFGDTDVSGKILLFLVNDPPLVDAFGGSAMTYYGRWTYKHEIAAELGAAGSLVIHEEGPAGYPWEVVGSTPWAESFDLVAADDNLGRATFEGWVQRATAETLFGMAGLDFEAAKQQAADRAFSPIPLGVTGSLRIRNELRRIDSQNVVAKIEGSEAPDEVVLYVAHWDHLGVDPGLAGDGIFNGAADNATGTAGLIEIARAFRQAPAPPRRSIVFLAVTAEEQGLLGSRHYGENPLYPAAQTVAALNMDVLNQWGRTSDLTIVGMGQSELDDVAAEVAARLGRTLAPDPEPEKGFYYRSDHFSFARAGIPAFYADPGVDYLDKPAGYGLEKRTEYTANDYHKVSDEIKPDWDLSGALEDLTFLYHMGAELADSDAWPAWSATSEFRAVREAQRPQ